MSATTNRQARASATDGTAHGLGINAAELAALRSDLGTLFARLCALAAGGATVLASALDTGDHNECADLIVAAEALFGMVGYVGELGAQACGDPGIRSDPASWLALGGGAAALHRLGALSEGARIQAAAAAVAAGSAGTGGEA